MGGLAYLKGGGGPFIWELENPEKVKGDPNKQKPQEIWWAEINSGNLNW